MAEKLTAIKPVTEDTLIATFDTRKERQEFLDKAAAAVVELGLQATHCVEPVWITLPATWKGGNPQRIPAVKLHVYTAEERTQLAADRAELSQATHRS